MKRIALLTTLLLSPCLADAQTLPGPGGLGGTQSPWLGDVDISPLPEPEIVVDGYIKRDCNCVSCQTGGQNSQPSAAPSGKPSPNPFLNPFSNVPASTGGTDESPRTLMGIQNVRTDEEGERLKNRWEQEVEKELARNTARAQLGSANAQALAAACLNVPELPPPPHAPVVLEGRSDNFEEIRNPLMPEPANNLPSGQTVADRVCSETPGCNAQSAVACTRRPLHASVPLYYYIKLEAVCNPNAAQYEVTEVYLKGPPETRHHLVRTRRGQITLWEAVKYDTSNAASLRIWNDYMRDQANGDKRMQYLEKFSISVLWHEDQHRRHIQEWLLKWETILNTPHYPSEITLGCEDRRDPIQVVAGKITEQMLIRRNNLYAAYVGCTIDDFHGADDAPGGYKEIMSRCACEVNAPQCNQNLPAFDPSVPWSDDSENCHALFQNPWT